MPDHEQLNYVEFPAHDLSATKKFFESAFGWTFTDFGPEYTSFANQGLDGGFFQSAKAATVDAGSALLVFYSDRLEDTQSKVSEAGGKVTKPIFPFPGGRRFHFVEPSGNEFAVWGEDNA